MSRPLSLGRLGLLFLLLVVIQSAWAMNVDSLPVWDPSILVRENGSVGVEVPVSGTSEGAEELRRDSIETHGYKTMQITVGNGGTQVDQELRLSITGRLSDSVWIDALLSDVGRRAGDQTTATLREVDQIYFRVESPHYFLHLGDLIWSDHSMDLFSIERSSLGAMGGVRGDFGGGRTEVRGVIGTDEVQHFRRVMKGVSGQREGYALDGAGSFVAIVPQSETVWLNGVRLTRGVDYLVNYAGGILDFKGGVVPSFDDEIRVEYDAYENDNIYTLKGANASYRHPNLYLDLSMFQLENDADRLRRGVWTDDDYRMLKADRGGPFVREDTLGELRRPDKTRRMGARLRLQQNRQFYADMEIAMNKSDSNVVSNHVGGPEGSAFRWFVTTDSTRDQLHFPLALDVYGNRIGRGYDVTEFRGDGSDWDTYVLQDQWDLAYGGGTFLDDDLLYDELKFRTAFGGGWFSEALLGYRRNDDEDWNASRAKVALLHRNRRSSSEVAFIRVASVSDREMERYQGTATAELLDGFIRPFGQGDLRYTQIDGADEVLYGKSMGGFGMYFDRGDVKESVGGRMARHRGDSYGNSWSDSLRSATWLQEANYNSRYFTLNHLLQYERVAWDSAASENSWVGNLDARMGSDELGLAGSVSYKLGLTEEQIYTSVYKAVAPGTGDVRYDSLTGTFIEGVDNGDFVYDGMGRNDSVGAVLSSEASFGADFRWNPGLSLGIRRGILRDVTFGGSWRGEGSDTTGRTLYFPPVTVAALRRTTSGRIDMEGLVEWNHPVGVSLSYKPGVAFDKKLSSLSYFETVYSHEIEADYQINLDHFIGATLLLEDDELSALQVWNWNVYDASLKYRFEFLNGFFVQPLGRYRVGSGADNLDNDFDADLWEGTLSVGYNKPGKIDGFASFSAVQVDRHGDIVPYQVMTGFSEGRTYRLEVSLSVDLNDFVSLGCHYVLRFGNSEENLFQKLSTEARAVF